MEFGQLGNYMFCSKAPGKPVGSIYFEHGRIRLCHDHGPTIAMYNKNISFHTTRDEAEEFRGNYRGKNADVALASAMVDISTLTGTGEDTLDLADYFKLGTHHHVPDIPAVDLRLLELYTRREGGHLHVHISRGKRVDIALHEAWLRGLFGVINRDDCTNADVEAYLGENGELKTTLGF